MTKNDIKLLKPKVSESSTKTTIITVLYLILGGTLLFFTARSIYHSLVNLEVETATIAKPLGPVISPVESVVAKEQGVIDELYVHEGMNVKPGQPLFSIKNDELAERDIDLLTREIQLNKTQLAQAQADLREAELLKQQEIEKLNSYKAISQTELNSAKTTLESQRAEYQIQKDNLERHRVLLEQGAISRTVYDQAKSRFVNAESELKEAESDYRVAQVAAATTQRGNFYDGERLISDLPRRTAEVQKLREVVRIASEKVINSERMLNQRVRELQITQPMRGYIQSSSQDQTLFPRKVFSISYKAPFPGSVLKVTKVAGNPVRPRETVMVLQREQAPPMIDVYLTPEEAQYIAIGTLITVQIPTLNKEYVARVSKLSHLPLSPNSDTRSVYVQLILDNLSPEDSGLILANRGIPVNVKISKQATNVFHRLQYWFK